ncbi:MAG TPA: hypothetical protein VFF59_04070 [Anaerolineae bacterium]|nr:hypothetical protein [Anaerolineae bacterium]
MNRPPEDSPRAEAPTNYRQMKRRTERNLIVGGFIILFVVGGGLVGLLYGVEAMLQSWLCISGGVALLGGFVLIFKLLETISKSGDE